MRGPIRAASLASTQQRSMPKLRYRFDPEVSSVVRLGSATVEGTAAPVSATTGGPLSDEQLRRIHRYWQAANYLTVGQIFLQENALVREPLRPEHIKPRLLGHWGTTPGLTFCWAHLNRVIRREASRRCL
jgi:hypothetical protein